MGIKMDDLNTVVQSIWQSILGEEIAPAPDGGVLREGSFFASIRITGGWNGTIHCVGSDGLVRRMAAKMFETDFSRLSPEALNDAFGEIANMVGGNIKALLPGQNVLGLPRVMTIKSLNDTPLTQSFAAHYHSHGLSFSVSIIEVDTGTPV